MLDPRIEGHLQRPGIRVCREWAYQRHGAVQRHYWESGSNVDLTRHQRDVLSRWGDVAISAVPDRNDHGSVVHAVAHFVHEAMPQGDIEGREAPKRSLGWIIDTGVGERRAVRPPDTATNSGAPGWVCINAVDLGAALFRELGYPVRECNVVLAQNGTHRHGFRGAVYQEAALQVWFKDAWHWVDPYLLIFDPAFTRDDRSHYKVDQPCYWSGTARPPEWLPGQVGSEQWTPFGLLEPLGSDLHRRFFPRQLDERGCEPPPVPDARVRRLSSTVDRREGTATSGVFIRTRTQDVTLELEDVHGRTVGADGNDIPGAVHIARGALMPALDPRAESGPGAPFLRSSDTLTHLETVFFGTQSLLAAWEEVGRHRLILTLRGPRRARVDLTHEIIPGDHLVTVSGLPDELELDSGTARIPLDICIDPLDAQFHTSFALLSSTGALQHGMYWPATDDIRAIQERGRVAAAGRSLRAPLTGPPEG